MIALSLEREHHGVVEREIVVIKLVKSFSPLLGVTVSGVSSFALSFRFTIRHSV